MGAVGPQVFAAPAASGSRAPDRSAAPHKAPAMHQARSVGLHTNEPGMMHAGVYENAPPSTASTTRTESEYRYTQKGGPQNSGRFGHPKKNATPPAAFGNAEAPMGQPFRDTQVRRAFPAPSAQKQSPAASGVSAAHGAAGLCRRISLPRRKR